MCRAEVVITGMGIVSPVGIGCKEFWTALMAGRSGVRRIEFGDCSRLPIQVAAEVRDFHPQTFVANRKSLKVMSRDAQLGMAAAALACREAGIAPGNVDPDRFGVVLGAGRICEPLVQSQGSFGACMVGDRFDFGLWGSRGLAATFPLAFLRVCPNMTASHISIAQDARGPNNTIHHAEVSSLLALGEATEVIRRGMADVMLAGGASWEMHLFDCVHRCVVGILSPRQEPPAAVMRPFDARRDGQVWGEGAAIFVLESRRHAEARRARILARVLAWASTCETPAHNGTLRGSALRRVIQLAMARSGLDRGDLGHVNAHGLSTVREDRLEAQALADVLPGVPVTALKSYFGNLGAAGAAMEVAASVLSFQHARVPATLNYEHPDPACPVAVIHGGPMPCHAAAALSLTWLPQGQAAAIVLGSTE
jgi:3-oxoacyl-[acyl-carrier-protein] synthase II